MRLLLERFLPESVKQGWQQISVRLNLSETRTQILLCYLGLMLLFVGASMPMIYRTLFQNIEQRLQADLIDEVQEFLEALDSASPQTQLDLEDLANQYLDDELVDPGQYFIFIVDGQFYSSSPAELPASIQNGSPLMEKWRSLSQMAQSQQTVADPNLGTVIYRVEPIFLGNQMGGAFVAVHTTGSAQQQVRQIVQSVLWVMLLLLVIAAGLAWLISGRILQPLRSMMETARSISEANLSKRIAVRGQGELAQVASTFNEMMDRLQASFLSQQNFINDASHELRTPITIIQGHLELMSDDPEEQQEVIAIVNDELNRMNRFVNDLLTLAKAGRPDFMQPEWIELESFTEELYQKARVIADCDCALDAAATGNFQLDRQRFTQAVLNLVENANQYTPATGLIAIGSSKSRKNIRLWVRDTGKGISAADQKRIFERFARGTTAQRRSEGAGLGLSIVRAIAAAAGGRIEVKSKLGEGSTFTLILPIPKQQRAKRGQQDQQGERSAQLL
ncbi:MAG: HAMP domain-containing histidine kinase [Pegethrix bostrychoides GSE-TBD4-15B]|jgi:signal transduction histidine kinase|uniref:histidine kinase n=1 Tax=Pegethrix bostrychoides GSE-TBD4-15B TaxID=2839662 RepID=A0A951U8B4_9CYAN|nr:HAMP domain-containing histidine kinase [Pegethrix bostrychoides GSE-TBD4-15B]